MPSFPAEHQGKCALRQSARSLPWVAKIFGPLCSGCTVGILESRVGQLFIFSCPVESLLAWRELKLAAKLRRATCDGGWLILFEQVGAPDEDDDEEGRFAIGRL